jgi:dihydroneopterin aldolase
MAFDNRVPAASDAIADTLDYKAVSKRLIAFVSRRTSAWWKRSPSAAPR